MLEVEVIGTVHDGWLVKIWCRQLVGCSQWNDRRSSCTSSSVLMAASATRRTALSHTRIHASASFHALYAVSPALTTSLLFTMKISAHDHQFLTQQHRGSRVDEGTHDLFEFLTTAHANLAYSISSRAMPMCAAHGDGADMSIEVTTRCTMTVRGDSGESQRTRDRVACTQKRRTIALKRTMRQFENQHSALNVLKLTDDRSARGRVT
jgi:hypothetical protein